MSKTELLEQIKRGNLLAFRYASEELRGDREVVLEAVRQNGNALRYASKELQGDRELVLEAVRQDGIALWYASKELKEDREVVLAAVTKDGDSLQYASKELRGDPQVVLAAVRQDGYALEYASEELRADLNFIKEVIKQNPKLKENLHFILGEVRQNFFVLRFAEEKTITEAINQLSEEIPAANAYGVDTDNIEATRGFFETMKKEITTEELCCNIESFDHFFAKYSISYRGEQKGYIPYVANLFQSACKLSKRDAFILANCIHIGIHRSLNEEEGGENLKFLKSLLLSMVIPIAEEKQPLASIQPDGLTQSNVTQHFTQR